MKTDPIFESRLAYWGRLLNRSWGAGLGYPSVNPIHKINSGGSGSRLPALTDTTPPDITRIHQSVASLRRSDYKAYCCVYGHYAILLHNGKRPPIPQIVRKLSMKRSSYYKRLNRGRGYIKPRWDELIAELE